LSAIGVFDSGVGGLSLLREIRRELPHEPLLYVADSAHAPYGDKSESFVIARSRAIAEFLIRQGATSLVVACNTATAAAVDALRALHDVPIIGIEPGVKPAVEQTTAGVVGVLTTSRTAVSARFQRLLARFGDTTRILVQPCPGWVELVEQGGLHGPETERRVAAYVHPLMAQGADALVLGCTHYSFLAPVIRRIAGDGVTLIDPAPAVARHLRHRLEHLHLLSDGAQPSPLHIFTSSDPVQLQPVVTQLWGEPAPVQALPGSVSRPVPAARTEVS
jgi:glutamate racemase